MSDDLLKEKFSLGNTPFQVALTVEIDKKNRIKRKIQLITKEGEKLAVAVHQLAAYPDATKKDGVAVATLSVRSVADYRGTDQPEWETIGGKCEPKHMGLTALQNELAKILRAVQDAQTAASAKQQLQKLFSSKKKIRRIDNTWKTFKAKHQDTYQRFKKETRPIAGNDCDFRPPCNTWYFVVGEQAVCAELKEEACFQAPGPFLALNRQIATQVFNNDASLKQGAVAAILKEGQDSASTVEAKIHTHKQNAFKTFIKEGATAIEGNPKFRTMFFCSKNILYVADSNLLPSLCAPGERSKHDQVAFKQIEEGLVATYVPPRKEGDGFYKFGLKYTAKAGGLERSRAGADAIIIPAAIAAGASELPCSPLRAEDPLYVQLQTASIALRAQEESKRPVSASTPQMVIGAVDELGKPYFLIYKKSGKMPTSASASMNKRTLLPEVTFKPRGGSETAATFYRREKAHQERRIAQHNAPYTSAENAALDDALTGVPQSILQQMSQEGPVVQKVPGKSSDQAVFFCDMGMLPKTQLAQSSGWQAADTIEGMGQLSSRELAGLSQQLGCHPLQYIHVNGMAFAVGLARKNPDGIDTDVKETKRGIYRPSSLIVKYKNEQRKWVTIPIQAPWFSEMIKQAPGIFYSIFDTKAAPFFKRNALSFRVGDLFASHAHTYGGDSPDDVTKVSETGEYLRDVGGKAYYSFPEFLLKLREMDERSRGLIPDVSTKEHCLLLAQMYEIETGRQVQHFKDPAFQQYVQTKLVADQFCVPLKYLENMNLYRPGDESKKIEPWPESFVGREPFKIQTVNGHRVSVTPKLPRYIQEQIKAELQQWDTEKALSADILKKAAFKKKSRYLLTNQVDSQDGLGRYQRYSRETRGGAYGVEMMMDMATEYLNTNQDLPEDYQPICDELIKCGAISRDFGKLTLTDEALFREQLSEYIKDNLAPGNYDRVRNQFTWVEALALIPDASAFRGYLDHDARRGGQGANYHYFMFAEKKGASLEKQPSTPMEMAAQLKELNRELKRFGFEGELRVEYLPKGNYWHSRLIIVTPFKTQKDDKPAEIFQTLYARLKVLATRPPSKRKATAMFSGDESTPSAAIKGKKTKVKYSMLTLSTGPQHLLRVLLDDISIQPTSSSISESKSESKVESFIERLFILTAHRDALHKRIEGGATHSVLAKKLLELDADIFKVQQTINHRMQMAQLRELPADLTTAEEGLQAHLDAWSRVGRFDLVMNVLKIRPDVATTEFSDHSSLLHRAVEHGHLEGVNCLLNIPAVRELDMVRWNAQGYTVLHLNGMSRNHLTQLAIFNLLLERGVNINTPTAPSVGQREMLRPIDVFRAYAPAEISKQAVDKMVASRKQRAPTKSEASSSRSSLDTRRIISRVDSDVSMNAMILATSAQGANPEQPNFNLSAVKSELSKYPQSVNTIFDFGLLHKRVNLLHWAVYHRQPQAIEFLCRFAQEQLDTRHLEAFLNHQDQSGYTPLHLAFGEGALFDVHHEIKALTISQKKRSETEVSTVIALLRGGVKIPDNLVSSMQDLLEGLVKNPSRLGADVSRVDFIKLVAACQARPGQVLDPKTMQAIMAALTPQECEQFTVLELAQGRRVNIRAALGQLYARSSSYSGLGAAGSQHTLWGSHPHSGYSASSGSDPSLGDTNDQPDPCTIS